MEEDGLVKRIVVSSRPVHTEYAVTDKGMMVEPVLEALADIYEIRTKSNIQGRKIEG